MIPLFRALVEWILLRFRSRMSLEVEVLKGSQGLPPELSHRAVDEYLAVLDDAAFGRATDITPKLLSLSDPAARWTGAHSGPAYFAYSANYLADLKCSVILDVERSTVIRQAEVTASKTMVMRVEQCFDLKPDRFVATLLMDRPRR